MFHWRAVTPLDSAALMKLDACCRQADGEEAVPQEAYGDVLNPNQADQICAVLAQAHAVEQVVACAVHAGCAGGHQGRREQDERQNDEPDAERPRFHVRGSRSE